MESGAIIKEKELQHSGCPESASLKEKPAEAGYDLISLYYISESFFSFFYRMDI